MYLPLEFCSRVAFPKPIRNPFLLSCSEVVRDGLVPDVLKMLTDSRFPEPSHKCKEILEPFRQSCIKAQESLLTISGIDPVKTYGSGWKDKLGPKLLTSELISPYIVVNEWAGSKQVYCFDPEMELALADTEEVEVNPSILERLPYNSFYIEFAEYGIFSSSAHGTFVRVGYTDGGYLVFFLRLRHDQSYHTGTCFIIDKDGIPTLINRDIDCMADGEVAADWGEFAMFVMNALLYLCAANSQIEENPVTKQTYHPYTTAKNRFSEVRKWDVGIRYGNAVRMMEAKGSVPAPGSHEETATAGANPKSRHKVPRPHMRRAHWHHYWIGKGRTELVLKWIEPVFVGSGYIPTVKHEVR